MGGHEPESSLTSLAADVQRLREVLDHHLAMCRPIEPMYSIPQAVILIPCRNDRALWSLLSRKRALFDRPLYRHDKRHRRYRMLSHRDVLLARRLLLRVGKTRHQAYTDLAARPAA
jgi:hypothetical protein